MTVKELIKILECFSDEAEVIYSDYTEITDIDSIVTNDENCKEYVMLR